MEWAIKIFVPWNQWDIHENKLYRNVGTPENKSCWEQSVARIRRGLCKERKQLRSYFLGEVTNYLQISSVTSSSTMETPFRSVAVVNSSFTYRFDPGQTIANFCQLFNSRFSESSES
jgi:hypothetical protein